MFGYSDSVMFLGLLLALGAALHFFRAFRRVDHQLMSLNRVFGHQVEQYQHLSKQVEQMSEEAQTLKKCLQDTTSDTHQLSQQLHQLDRRLPDAQAFAQLSELIDQGVDLDEVSKTLGVSSGEAELIRSLVAAKQQSHF